MSFYLEEECEVLFEFDYKELAQRVIDFCLEHEKFEYAVEVNLTLTNNEGIHMINKEYRQIDRPTDVLSFPMGENGDYPVNPETNFKILGDIVISVERAVTQADEYDHSLRRELGFLTTHSMLHLLGYDHVNGGIEAAKMREREEEVMELVGQPRDMA